MANLRTVLVIAALGLGACAPKAPELAAAPVAETPTPAPTVADAPPPGTPWNKGGTLHKVSAREWKAAGAWNRLATSADWALQTVPEDKRAALADEEHRHLANMMMDCVNEQTYLPQEVIETTTETTADFSTRCIERISASKP